MNHHLVVHQLKGVLSALHLLRFLQLYARMDFGLDARGTRGLLAEGASHIQALCGSTPHAFRFDYAHRISCSRIGGWGGGGFFLRGATLTVCEYEY